MVLSLAQKKTLEIAKGIPGRIWPFSAVQIGIFQGAIALFSRKFHG